MSQNILICVAHPRAKSLNESLAEAYAEGAQEAGHQVEFLKLRELQFDPILHEAYEKEQALEPDLLAAQKKILDSQHFVLFSPVWWGQLPALAKGFFDRCFLPEFAFRFQESGLPEGLLGPRSAHIVLTMGSPYLFYRMMFRKCADRAIGQAIFKFCGFQPVRFTHVSKVDDLHESEIEEYLDEMRDKGREAY